MPMLPGGDAAERGREKERQVTWTLYDLGFRQGGPHIPLTPILSLRTFWSVVFLSMTPGVACIGHALEA